MTSAEHGAAPPLIPLTSAPRVLLIGNFLSATGTAKAVGEELAERLAGGGWRVSTTSGQPNRLLRIADMLGAVWSRRNSFDVAQIDVFSGLAFVWAELVAALLRAIGRPYVLTLHGGNLPVFARHWPQRARRLLSSAARVTAPSNYLRNAMRDCRGDIILLPNAIDLSAYRFARRSNPRPEIVWLRSFHDVYQPELAIHAFHQLRSAHPNARLTMVGPDKGDGSYQRARELARQLEFESWVRFIPGVPKAQVPLVLGEADLFLNTPSTDNTPVAVVEAMACGLCIVSTDVGGLRDLVDDGSDALLAPAGDASALANAMHRILTEPGLAGRLSGNARRKAEEMDWSTVLPRWQSLLAEVAGETRRSDPK
jgi:glycosyltransferase involved in cell wall biosynthesis